MKMVQAIIQQKKMDKVRKPLEGRGFAAMSVLDITGRGGNGGIIPGWNGFTGIAGDPGDLIKIEGMIP